MQQKTITLSTHEDLKIFMSPQRQKLLRLMRIEGIPMTAKAIADMLGVSASSVKHHINKLMDLGILELSHKKIINGITASYYKLSDVTVSIGSKLNDGLSSERTIIIQDLIKNTLDGIARLAESGIPSEEIKDHGDFLNGVVHLTPDDSKKLLEIIRSFITEHETKQSCTEPWEYSLILYNAGLTK